VYLSSLIRKVQNEGVLTDFTKLYGLAQVASSSMQLSRTLTPDAMVSMAQALRDIPTENIVFVQYPTRYGQAAPYLGKVEPLRDQAAAIFDRIKADKPFTLDGDSTGVGSNLNPNAPSAEPTPEATPTEEPRPPKNGKVEPEPTAEPTVPPVGPTEEPDKVSGLQGQTAADFTCSRANN